MPAPETPRAESSARLLTLAAYVSFVPNGIVTVLLGPMLPTLSARWSLSYSQAGALFTVQYLAATVAVALSGVLVSRFGYRFAIKAGLLLAAAGIAFLLTGPRLLGMICIAAYGAGQGLSGFAGNLLVAEVNPKRRGATLNLLNFCWSTGSVSCPFLVAAAAKSQHVPLLLGALAGFLVLVVVGIAVMPSYVVEPSTANRRQNSFKAGWRNRAFLPLAALFFVYVGTEDSFGGWVASYSKTLGTMTAAISLMTPSFFYVSLMFGRWVAPLLLRAIDEVRLVQTGLVVACAGMAGFVLSRNLPGIAVSACLAGLGLSIVYPITIALLSREFGADGSRIGPVMFTMGNIGGALVPWIVGAAATQFASLKAGLAVPLVGGIAMFFLYLRDWKPVSAEQLAQ
jgi:MFS transporter, FHS family, glucose/mannose:H+ symporter